MPQSHHRIVRTSDAKLIDEFHRLAQKAEDAHNSNAPTVQRFHPSVIDRLGPHLDAQRIPTSNNLLSSQKDSVELALACIRVLASYITLAGTEKEYYEKAEILWPGLWEWAQYILRTRVEQHPGAFDHLPPPELQSVYTIFRALCACSQDERMRSVMCRTAGYAEAVTLYWLHEGVSELWERMELFSNIFARLLDSNPDFTEVYRSSNGPKNVARTALRYIRAQLGRPFNLRRVYDRLRVLHYLVGKPDSQTLPYLVQGGMIPLAVRCLDALNDKANEPVIRRAVYICNFLISGGIEHGRQRTVSQALENGFLPAMLGSAKLVERMESSEASLCLDILEIRFTPYLTHRSVVRVASAQVYVCEDDTPVFGPLKESWLAFKSAVLERKILKDEFDFHTSWSCSSCERSVSDRRTLRMCSGCKGPRYCSTECQRNSWPTHKPICLTFRSVLLDETRQAEEVSMNMTAVDKAFLMDIVYHDLQSQADTINACIERDHSDIPIQRLLFKMDLHRGPTIITLERLDPYWEQAVEKQPLHIRNFIEMEMVIFSIHVCWTPTCITIVERGNLPPGIKQPGTIKLPERGSTSDIGM